MSLLNLYVDVDDFCQMLTVLQPQPVLGRANRPGRKPSLAASEVMTIIIYFHMSRYRDFKTYYTQYVMKHLRGEFPNLVSYTRFVELMPLALWPLCLYLKTRFGPVTGISFIDATALPVCHNRRIGRHQVFDGLAARGKTSMGWFFGFKLHLVVNDCGDLLAFYVTPGNVDDRQPVPRLAKRLFGKLFGDKGYISQPLADQLLQQDIHLITGLRKNMKNRLLLLFDKLMLRKRALIETITDQLKNISQVAHTRHRSVDNFLVNLVAGLIAYTHQPKKPSLNLRDGALALLPATLI
jgi:transposase